MSEVFAYYQCKSRLIPARAYSDVVKIARKIFHVIERRTKRRPYLRSAFFKGEKIFLDNFWSHLNNKLPAERRRRLRYFQCAVELIESSKISPLLIKQNSDGKEKFYRFLGKAEQQYFIVQIKEDLTRKQKFFMSVFEYQLKK